MFGPSHNVISIVLCLDDRRKYVGYLWAMKTGAKVIYDTDDSYAIHGPIISLLDTSMLPSYVVNTSTTAINVYNNYGLEHVGPRGFPIAHA